MIAAQTLPDAGFVFRHETKGGYGRLVHEDGSQVWIKPSGDVVRLGPKVKAQSGKKYHPRFDQRGKVTKSHSTGEKLVSTGR